MQMSSKSFINAYILYGSICVCVCANCTITWKGGKCTLSNSNGKNMTFDFATYFVGICAVISMQHYNFLFAKLNFNTFETMLSFFCGSSRGRSRTSFGPFPDALRIASGFWTETPRIEINAILKASKKSRNWSQSRPLVSSHSHFLTTRSLFDYQSNVSSIIEEV